MGITRPPSGDSDVAKVQIGRILPPSGSSEPILLERTVGCTKFAWRRASANEAVQPRCVSGAYASGVGTVRDSLGRWAVIGIVLALGLVMVGGSLFQGAAHATVLPAASPPTTLVLGFYTATFQESGLPTGSTWSVTLNGSTSSAVAPLSNSFVVSNGTYSYTVGQISGYSASPSSGTLTVTNGNVNVTITFAAVAPTKYPVAFSETGLTSNTTWSVALNGTSRSASAPSTISFSETNGSYSFTVGALTGYTASPSSGSVSVKGAAVNQSVAFTHATSAPTKYNVTFTETGLANGTSWSVTLNGTVGSATAPASISIPEPNGTYAYTVGAISGYSASPSSGSVAVSGSAVTQAIAFSSSSTPPQSYSVTFSEIGLPAATTWSVTLNGSTSSALAPGSIQFSERNGTYSFTVGSVSGFSASPSSGSVAVNGVGVNQSIRFSSTSSTTKHAVTFAESGIPSGTRWSVTLNSTTQSATAPSSIGFNLTDGTYSFSVGAVSGYAADPSSGSITVSGNAVHQAIAFGADIQHVVVIVLENYELSTVLANGPYEKYLWDHYGHASNFYGTCHQSKPEYAAMTSGRSFTCASFPVESVTNLADLVEQKGLSWAGYFEAMPSACDTTNAYPYTIYHNPFLDYSDIVNNATRCDSHDINSKAFNASVSQGTLPTVSFYVPNSINDCHDSTVASCDSWLKGFLSPMLNSTNTTVHRLMAHTAFFVVYDEGGTNAGYSVGGIVNSWCKTTTGKKLTVCGGHVLMSVVSPYSVGTNYTADATDYSLESTIEWLFGLGRDGGYDGTSNFPSMSGLFTFAHNGVVASAEVNMPQAASFGWGSLMSPIAMGLLGGSVSTSVGLALWARRRRGQLE